MIPFEYPTTKHTRLHGPAGYSSHESYRPWLRDDFSFRCIYCLRREQWGRVIAEFAIDHFFPVSRRPEQDTIYENLVYSCSSCNSRKSDADLPNPSDTLTSNAIEVREDGNIEGQTDDARRIIRLLYLNRAKEKEFRKQWIEILRLAAAINPELYRKLMGYPEDLPDLSVLRPPDGNSKPEGIEQSHRKRRERGELPETY